MVTIPLIHYHFESYKDINGHNRIKIDSSTLEDFNEDLATGEYNWINSGTAFKLTPEGNLTLSPINQELIQESNPRFKISGANIVALGGQHFQELNIVAQEVQILGDLSAANLEIASTKMSNQSLINVETTKIAVDGITNSGKIQASKTIDITSATCDNSNGGLHAGETLKLTTEHLKNIDGNLSGIHSTFVDIGKSLTNSATSEIGASGKTTVTFKEKMTVGKLGIIRGEEIQLVNPATITTQGIIAASKEILLTSPTLAIVMPNVDFQTPVLRLQTPKFKLSDQTHCEHTIVETTVGKSIGIVMNKDYRTTGTFAFQEPGVTAENIEQIMLERFGEIANYNAETMPEAKYNIIVQANIQANKGIKALTPFAKINLSGKEDRPTEFLTPEGALEVYATEFDVVKGGVQATDGFVWAPKGVTLGRLIEDPNRKVVAKVSVPNLYSAGIRVMCVNQRPCRDKYTFLNHNYLVHERGKLNMPAASSNGSFLRTSNKTKIIGKFMNQGSITTHHLEIDTTSGASAWHSAFAQVSGDCVLVGVFGFNRTIGKFNFFMEGNMHDQFWRSSISYDWNFCNSDPAKLEVQGKLSGNATINNEAGWIYAYEKSPELSINGKDITTPIPQGFVNNGVAQEMQQTFPAQTSFGSTVIMPVRDTTQASTLEGMISAPNIIITLGGKLALGSPNPYYINPQNPIRDLMSKGFNMHTTYYMPDKVKQLLKEAEQPKFYFMFRERFWFDEQKNQEFYRDIAEHVIIKDGNTASFKKPKPDAIFSLSVNYLLDRVREECQEVLMRGFIYADRPIDENLIKELHQNTTEYLKAINFSAEEFQQAVVEFGKNPAVPLPTKPMLYYKELIDDHGLEVLSPYLYIPESMINEVRARRGGLVKTNVLLTLPDNLTPKELLKLTQARPALQKSLTRFFKHNPRIKQSLTEKALQIKAQELENAVQVSNPEAPKPSLTMGGSFEVGTTGIVADGVITVNGNIAADTNAFLESIHEDVEVKSLTERTGNSENFDDQIVSQARVAAKQGLDIYAGRNVIFQGAETASGVGGSRIKAKGELLDIPVTLISQRTQHFHEKKKSGTVTDTYIANHTSSHTSEQHITMHADGSSTLYCPRIKAKTATISSKKRTSILAVANGHEHTENLRSKKRQVHGGNKVTTTSAFEFTETSQGAQLDVEFLNVAGGEAVELQQIHSAAKHNKFSAPEGKVYITHGRNRFLSSRSTRKSDMTWQKSVSTSEKRATFSSSSFAGTIEMEAQQAVLETVSGQVLSFLDQITLKPDDLIFVTLREEYERHSKTVQGPGAGLVALVALVTAIATQGAALQLLSGVAKGAMHAALSAGFTGLCSQAAASITANNGNIFKAAKALATMDTVKQLAISMISAGAMDQVGSKFKIPKQAATRSTPQNIAHHAAKTSIDAGLNIRINHQKAGVAFKSGMINAAFAIVGGKLDAMPGLSENQNSALHAMLGGVRGTVVKGQHGWLHGAMEGAISARLPGYLDKRKQAREDRNALLKAALERARNPKKLEQEELTQAKLFQAIVLQEDQTALITKIEDRVKLFARKQSQLDGKVINITEHMANVTAQIMALDLKQVKALDKAIDQSITLQSTTGNLKVRPVVLQLLPLATQWILRLALPSAAAYFFGKAAVDTQELYKSRQQDEGQAAYLPGFQKHRNKPTFVTPEADPLPPLPGFEPHPHEPISYTTPYADQETSSEFIFTPAEPIPHSEGFPIEQPDHRNGLFFSKPAEKPERQSTYHHHNSRGGVGKGNKSACPTNPTNIEKAIQITDRQFIVYEPKAKEIIISYKDRNGDCHEHVRTWSELTQTQQNVLMKNFNFKPNGKVKVDCSLEKTDP